MEVNRYSFLFLTFRYVRVCLGLCLRGGGGGREKETTRKRENVLKPTIPPIKYAQLQLKYTQPQAECLHYDMIA